MGTSLFGLKPKNTYQALLKTTANTAIDATLRTISDGLGNDTPLQLSLTDTQINSTLRVHTNNAELLDLEDVSSNNRFNINRDVQKINLDFASRPGDLTTVVGAIRTATDGVNLAEVMSFRENGQIYINQNFSVGTTTTTGARTTIKGSGATSATTSLLVQNSAGTAALTVKDDLTSTFNGNVSVSGNSITLVGAISNTSAMRIDAAATTGLLRLTTNSVNIGGNTTNNASALLQVDSTTQGFLPPRMTTAQKNAIVTPAAGLMVYDTTLNKLCVRTAATWETITSI